MGCFWCKKNCFPYPNQPYNKKVAICGRCFEEAKRQSTDNRKKTLKSILQKEKNIYNNTKMDKKKKYGIIKSLNDKYAKDIQYVDGDLWLSYPDEWYLDEKALWGHEV